MAKRPRIFRPATILGLVLGLVLLGVLWLVVVRLMAGPGERGGQRQGAAPAPVEVAQIERGPLQQRRTFSGTLAPRAEASVAPKISGRIVSISANLGDTVERGQVIAELDDDEAQQEVAQAEAELAVAEANLAEAQSALATALREYERVQTLQKRGVASESQLDIADADRLAREAEKIVAEAEVRRAESALTSANIRLGYTQVQATWADGDDFRVVAERFVDAGDTVSANTPLIRVVRLDPLDAVVFVTERDYARMSIGQPAALVTDAFPGEQFEAHVVRLAPVFRQESRQARVELEVSNPEGRLKPGMFARVTIVLDSVEDATIVPVTALLTREGQMGVFIVDAEKIARFVPVEVGIRTVDRAAVTGEGLHGRVVTLGQQLVQDGMPVTIPSEEEAQTRPASGPGQPEPAS
jgi:RND family efflux transporter MFP subunit